MKKKNIATTFYAIYTILIIIVYWQFILYLQKNFPEYAFALTGDPDTAKGAIYTIELSISLLYLFLGFQFIIYIMDKNNPIQKEFFMALSLFYFSVGIAQLCSVIDSIHDHKIFEIPGTPFNGIIVYAFFIGLLGLIKLSGTIDTRIRPNISKNKRKKTGGKKTRVLMIINLIGLISIAAIFLNYAVQMSRTMILIFFGIGLLIFLTIVIYLIILYIIIGIRTSGEMQKNAYTISAGYLLVFSGLILHMIRASIPFEYNYITFLGINLIGLILMIYGYLHISLE